MAALRRRALGPLAVAPALVGCGQVAPFGGQRSGRWEKRAGLSTARDDFGLAVAGGRLIAIGGMTGARGNALDAVEVYDPTSNAWTRGPRLPVQLSSLRAASLEGGLHVAGGAQEHAEVAGQWLLPPTGARWQPLAPLGTGRLGHGMAALGGRLVVAGGLVGGEASASAEAYDPARDRWTAIAPLPQPRFNLALVPLQGRLYALGGSGTDRRPSSAVAVYDPTADRWSPGPPLPQPMSNFGAAERAGRWLHALLHKDHFVLDSRADAGGASASEANGWRRAAPMPTSRHGLGVAVLGGYVYAAGGCSEDPQLDLPVVERFLP